MALNLGFSAALGAAPNPEFNNLFAAPVVEERARRFLPIAARANGTTGPTISLFMDSADDDFHFAASIVDACVSTTVYAIQCTSHPSRSYTDACGPNAPVPPPPPSSPHPSHRPQLTSHQKLTITEGATTYRISTDVSTRTMGVDVAGAVEENCSLEGTTKAVCGATIKASAQGTSTSTNTTATATGTDVYWFDVAITAGAEKTASPTQCAKSAASGLNVRGVAVMALLGALGVGAFLGC